MIRIVSQLTERWHRLSDTQLRILYSAIAVTSLAWIVITATFFIKLANDRAPHSDDLIWTERQTDGDTALYVSSIFKGGRAEEAGIKVGDQIIAIAGREISGSSPSNMAQDVLNETPIDTTVSYVVKRDGKVLNLWIRLRLDQRRNALVFRQSLLLVFPAFAVVWLIVATMVALAQPHGIVQRRFFATGATVIFAFSLSGAVSGSAAATIPVSSTTTLIVTAIQLLLGVLFYPLWLRFCTTFPIDQKVFSTRLRRILLFTPVYLYLCLLTATTIAFSILSTTRITLGASSWLGMVIGVAIALGLLICFLYFYGGILFLYLGYRNLPSTVNRAPMRVILIGAGLTGFALLYFIAVLILDSIGEGIIPSLAFFYPVVLLLALPVSFGYAIFKYQVMDFRLVVRTTLVYTATMTLIAGLYIAIGYAIGQAFDLLFQRSVEGVVGVIGFVLFLTLFDPVKRQVQTAIENRFFPERRNYSEFLASYSAHLSETLGKRGVAELIATTLRTTLDLHEAVVRVEDLIVDGRTDTTQEIGPEDAALLDAVLQETRKMVPLNVPGTTIPMRLRAQFPYAIGLYAQGRMIGTVLMSDRRNGEPISGSQTSFIDSVAAQGAAALEIARLYEEEIARRRYQEDLATARRIQESLLPTNMPQLPGISISAIAQPAQAVGGDYYDVLKLDDARLLVIVADVSGKGLPASLYMAGLHGMIRIAGAKCETPKEILSTLNEHLYDGMSRGMFVTAGVLLLDTVNRTASYVRAGHTPLLHIRSDAIDTLTPQGMGLGLCGNGIFIPSLQQKEIHYSPGESFILYSDGLSEAMNTHREEFGEPRLLELLRTIRNRDAQTIRNTLLETVGKFRGGAEQNDDTTIVVIQARED